MDTTIFQPFRYKCTLCILYLCCLSLCYTAPKSQCDNIQCYIIDSRLNCSDSDIPAAETIIPLMVLCNPMTKKVIVRSDTSTRLTVKRLAPGALQRLLRPELKLMYRDLSISYIHIEWIRADDLKGLDGQLKMLSLWNPSQLDSDALLQIFDPKLFTLKLICETKNSEPASSIYLVGNMWTVEIVHCNTQISCQLRHCNAYQVSLLNFTNSNVEQASSSYRRTKKQCTYVNECPLFPANEKVTDSPESSDKETTTISSTTTMLLTSTIPTTEISTTPLSLSHSNNSTTIIPENESSNDKSLNKTSSSLIASENDETTKGSMSPLVTTFVILTLVNGILLLVIFGIVAGVCYHRKLKKQMLLVNSPSSTPESKVRLIGRSPYSEIKSTTLPSETYFN